MRRKGYRSNQRRVKEENGWKSEAKTWDDEEIKV